MLLFTSDLQFLYKSGRFCPQIVFASKDKNLHLPAANKMSSFHARSSSLMLPAPVFHFPPALSVVAFGSRKTVKYLHHHPFYFPGQPII